MGIILDWLKLEKKSSKNNLFKKILENKTPILSSFGDDIFCADIVMAGVAAVAREIGQLALCAIKEEEVFMDGVARTTMRQLKGGINTIFKYKPNELTTIRSLMEWVGYAVVVNENAFLYPTFRERLLQNGMVAREYTGLYGIKADTVAFDFSDDGTPLIGFIINGKSWVLPYRDVIHIRKRFGQHSFLGGNGSGTLFKEDMLKSLRTMNVIEGGIEKAIRASLEVHGVMELVGASEVSKRNKKLEDLEDHVNLSKYGFLVTDFESNLKQLTIPLPNVPKEIIEWMEEKVLLPIGVSLPIVKGKWTDEEYNAFFVNTIAPMKNEIEQAFTACFFTEKEVMTYGKKIKVYDNYLNKLSLSKRMDLLKIMNGTGVLSNDEERALSGFEPNGEPTFVSLNYADKKMISAYQMARAKMEKEEKKASEANN